MWGVRVGTDTGIREGNTVLNLYHTRHFFKVNLVHDAITGWNNVDIIERGFGPVDKMEAVFVTTLFYFTVLLKASSSKPPNSTAKEWSTISWVCTTGFTLAGSPPFSAMASRRPARSTRAVCPKIS